MEFTANTRIDRYILTEPLGEGGQGAVWKAEDPLHPDQPRALKLVPVLPSRPADAERVRREARALAKLDHPSLVRCHGLFEDLQHGVLGLSMDYIDGPSLKALASDQKLTNEHRTAVLGHVASALSYLHAQQILHRDLKLDNVLVSQAFWAHPEDPSTVKLVDFGIAAQQGNPEPLTQVGSVIGTLAYLAPELIDPSHFGLGVASPASDVFAWGVVGWQLLAGEHPTGLPTQSSMVQYATVYRKAAESDVPWPPGGPGGDWGDLLRAALVPRPGSRISDGSVLSERARAITQVPAVVRPPSTGSSGPTSVASPAAMVDDTAAQRATTGYAAQQGADTSAVSAQTQASASLQASQPPTVPTNAAGPAAGSAPAPSTADRPSRAPAFLLGIVVAGAAAAGAYFLHQSQSRSPSRPVAPTPPTAQTSQPQEPETNVDAEVDAGEALVLPSGCQSTELCECCPSGHDCSCTSDAGCLASGCDLNLEPDEGFFLRLAEAKVGEKDLIDADEDLKDGKVCVKISGRPDEDRVCMALADALGDSEPEKALYVEGLDLSQRGLDITVEYSESPVPYAIATFKAPVKRHDLCTGLRIKPHEGEVDSITFFLDLHPAPPATRCPR